MTIREHEDEQHSRSQDGIISYRLSDDGVMHITRMLIVVENKGRDDEQMPGSCEFCG